VTTGAATPSYELYDRLAVGRLYEVVRAMDLSLGCPIALKIVREEHADAPQVAARLTAEARLTASLRHPAVLHVHGIGRLPDGRAFFAMEEVRGRTFTDLIQEVHQRSDHSHDHSNPDALRRLIAAFRDACAAVAHAHGLGIIHQDLKPDNLMVGEFGRVRVLDWGFARRLDDPDASRELEGTPIYLAPDRLAGSPGALTGDVYSLGAILYQILTGHTPYPDGDVPSVLDAVLRGPPPLRVGGVPAPEAMRALSVKAMARDPRRRPADAAALTATVEAWLTGEARLEHARALISEADQERPRVDGARRRASALRAHARVSLEALPLNAPVPQKREAWRMEDRAAELERESLLGRLRVRQLLRAALTRAPEMSEAHRRLADEYRRLHAEAEAEGRGDSAARLELLLRAHDQGWYKSYLAGRARLTLLTDAPEATVTLRRYQTVDRRLVADEGERFTAPMREVGITRGSYLAEIQAPGRHTVRYPVWVDREEHWDLVPPGASAPSPIALPREGELGDDDIYIPAGWATFGGDSLAAGKPLPRGRLWIPSFVVKRFPVTNAEYIAFLNDLAATGREAEAIRYAPRERGASGAMIYGRDSAGGFHLAPDSDGDVWGSDWPVLMIDWFCASAYAAWYAARTDRPWRLLSELEWEKAARGVDGRFFPWGDFLDPTWCRMLDSHTERALAGSVRSYEVDESPYGVRGMGGNAYDWCRDEFRQDGPLLPGEVAPAADEAAFRVIRGGSWTSAAGKCRAAFRSNGAPHIRSSLASFRIARDYPPDGSPPRPVR